MNERIRELAEQATRTVTMLSPGGSFEETNEYFDKEKFAELIVRECCDVVADIPIDALEPDYKILAQHFGVKYERKY